MNTNFNLVNGTWPNVFLLFLNVPT